MSNAEPIRMYHVSDKAQVLDHVEGACELERLRAHGRAFAGQARTTKYMKRKFKKLSIDALAPEDITLKNEQAGKDSWWRNALSVEGAR